MFDVETLDVVRRCQACRTLIVPSGDWVTWAIRIFEWSLVDKELFRKS
jgi:hypothetical protein